MCLPLINAASRDIEKGVFPKSCSLNVEIPTSPSSNKVCVLKFLNDMKFHFRCKNFRCIPPTSIYKLSFAFDQQGFRLTKQSAWRSTPNWQAISANRYPTGHFMSNQQSLGIQLAQLGRDASAAVSDFR